jgi:hypothetical protein
MRSVGLVLEFEHLSPNIDDNWQEWWSSCQGQITQKLNKGFSSIVICSFPSIWLEHNWRVFNTMALSPWLVADSVKEFCRVILLVSNSSLRRVIPLCKRGWVFERPFCGT